jgi:hypothetical protein
MVNWKGFGRRHLCPMRDAIPEFAWWGNQVRTGGDKVEIWLHNFPNTFLKRHSRSDCSVDINVIMCVYVLILKLLKRCRSYTEGEQNNGNTKKFRSKICVGYTERTSVDNTVCSYVCLQCVVFMSAHKWLFWVILRLKYMKKLRLVRFWKRIDRWCAFSYNICDKNFHIIRCIESDSF